MAVAKSKDPRVAFVLRYGLGAFVRDDYSAEASAAADVYRQNPAYALAYGPDAEWAAALATIAAVARGRAVDAEIERVLSHVNDVHFTSGPSETQTPTDVWNQRAYLAEVALA